tara:strand:+ start:1457 stop:1681 length:225 start_codon:yes stop_codon:yes gene_type:complete
MGSLLVSELFEFKAFEQGIVENMDGRDEYNDKEIDCLNSEIERLGESIVKRLGRGEMYDVMLENSELDDIEIKF